MYQFYYMDTSKIEGKNKIRICILNDSSFQILYLHIKFLNVKGIIFGFYTSIFGVYWICTFLIIVKRMDILVGWDEQFSFEYLNEHCHYLFNQQLNIKLIWYEGFRYLGSQQFNWRIKCGIHLMEKKNLILLACIKFWQACDIFVVDVNTTLLILLLNLFGRDSY